MSFLSKRILLFSQKVFVINQHTSKMNSPSTKLITMKGYATDSKTVSRFSRNIFKVGLLGVTVGGLVGTGYSMYSMNKPRAHIINEQTFIIPVKEIPPIKPTRSIQLLGDRSNLKLTLFQYQTCPFCCKVRAFLDYYGISYDIVEVDPVLRQSIKWSTYKKVPILVAKTADGYQPLNDSTMIISTLASYLTDTDKDIPEIVRCFPFIEYVDEDGKKKSDIMNKYFLMMSNNLSHPQNEKLNTEERIWRKWADDVLVHMLSPNVYRNREEAFQAFNWFSEVGEWEKNFPPWEKNLIIYVGASAMWLISKRLKKRHGLKDDVRQSLYDECNRWVKAVNVKGCNFMGGDQPNLADLAVYGILNSIEGCAAFKDLLTYTKIGKWYFLMKEAVAQHQGARLV